MNDSLPSIIQAIEEIMRREGLHEERIRSFLRDVGRMAEGELSLIQEASIAPIHDLPEINAGEESNNGCSERLKQLAVIKLNGGLGTGMGLNRAKSLVPVKNGLTFLDLIARQMGHLQQGQGTGPGFCLMNSFSTQKDTIDWLNRHAPSMTGGTALSFLQGQVPKLDAKTLMPAQYEPNPALEWCPPGHGDLYLSLLCSGMLDNLLDQDMNVAFISNSDNLGASVSPTILKSFLESGSTLMMEVARRTSSDRKGGHLAKRLTDDQYILRESAQCPPEDIAHFQDISRHRYFNTNNLWLRLDHLREVFSSPEEDLKLPLIRNLKRLDPANPHSPEVIQLETAMGAAIECFKRTSAIEVPRKRFSPVKSTADLLALRSDAYLMTPGHQLELHPDRQGAPPRIELDPSIYTQLDHFETHFGQVVPSMLECDHLKITGPVHFESGVTLRGKIIINNPTQEVKTIQKGSYENTTFQWD